MFREDFYKKYGDFEKVNKIIKDFHDLYYESSCIGSTWKNTKWLGIPIQKCPLDLLIFEELIFNTKPNIIIETGTKVGGSALFFANICDIIGDGEIITIDIDGESKVPRHGRITYLWGSSTDEAVVHFLQPIIKDKKVMVILDSNHSKEHVLKELEIYSKMVTVGNYLVIEDTNNKETHEAVQEFLKKNDNFKVDNTCEKFYLTFNPQGWLYRWN